MNQKTQRSHKNFRKALSFVFVILLSTIFLMACGTEESNEASAEGKKADEGVKKNISIATYQPGLAYHSVASGLASVISESSDMNATVRPFSGPKAWYPLMNDGTVDLGTTDYTVNWAYQGIKDNDEAYENVRTVILGNDVPLVGFTVREDSGIDSLKDLKGKKVAYYTVSPDSFHPVLEIQLNSVGLTWDDVVKVPVTGLDQGMEAMREGRVDAAFAGDPTVGLFLEVDNAIGIKGLNLADVSPDNFDEFPESIREEMPKILPGLEPVVIEGGFLDEPNVITQSAIALTAAVDLSEDTVYEVVKTLYENYEDLHPIFTWLEGWVPEAMFRPDPPVPYHSGAIKYFKEHDIWTEEAEENHQELLDLMDQEE